MRRSGTHLLIDAILNNFAIYKRDPLHIDLDLYLKNGYPLADLLRCHGYVIKTHFPQTLAMEFEPQVRAVAEQAFVLTPSRPLEEVYRSSLTFGATVGAEEFAKQSEQFDTFWRQYHPLSVPFAGLTNTVNYECLLAKIGQVIGVEPNQKPIYPFSKNQRALVYLSKTLTRLLGSHSPVVNTTISFAKSSSAKLSVNSP